MKELAAVAAADTIIKSDTTPDASEILVAVAKAVGAKTGAGLWVDVRTGQLDKGTTVTVYEKGPLGLIGLIGRKTFGAALGYDIAKSDKIEVSIFGGAAHAYDSALKIGWKPVAGVSIRF